MLSPWPALAQQIRTLEWSRQLEQFQVQPVILHRRKPSKTRHNGTAHVVPESIVIFGDNQLAFSVQTHGYPVGGLIHAELETGTVLESRRGDYSNPNFRHFLSDSAKVQADQTAHFLVPLTNRQGGYLKIRLPWHEMPGVRAPILTFPIQGPAEPCGQSISREPCRVLFGYGGAGQRD